MLTDRDVPKIGPNDQPCFRDTKNFGYNQPCYPILFDHLSNHLLILIWGLLAATVLAVSAWIDYCHCVIHDTQIVSSVALYQLRRRLPTVLQISEIAWGERRRLLDQAPLAGSSKRFPHVCLIDIQVPTPFLSNTVKWRKYREQE
jgi:hypothetical protein